MLAFQKYLVYDRLVAACERHNAQGLQLEQARGSLYEQSLSRFMLAENGDTFARKSIAVGLQS